MFISSLSLVCMSWVCAGTMLFFYDSVAYFDTSTIVLLVITLAEYFALPYKLQDL